MYDHAGTTLVNQAYFYNVSEGQFEASGHSVLTESAYHRDDPDNSAPWEPWTDATKLPNTTGRYYLTRDVKLASRATVQTTDPQNIILCLNGFTIDATNCSNSWAEVFYLKGKGHTLTICDCTATGDERGTNYKAGMIKGCTDGVVIGAPGVTGSTTKDENTGTQVFIRDGIFKGNTTMGVTGDSTPNSGGVLCLQAGASAVITGGQFVENTANAAGAIYITNGTLDISGAYFSGNTAKNGYGGAIEAGATNVTIADTVIENNTAQNSKGGGIYFNGIAKTLTLNGNVKVIGNTSGESATADDIYINAGSYVTTGTNEIGAIYPAKYATTTSSN